MVEERQTGQALIRMTRKKWGVSHVSLTVGRALQTEETAVLSGRTIWRIKRGMKNDAGWSPVKCGKAEVNEIWTIIAAKTMPALWRHLEDFGFYQSKRDQRRQETLWSSELYRLFIDWRFNHFSLSILSGLGCDGRGRLTGLGDQGEGC